MEVPPEYGITRKVDAGSFLDINFGEFFLLAQDVWRAPGFVNKLLYMVMPPGWSHTGDHKTATILRRSYIQRHPARTRHRFFRSARYTAVTATSSIDGTTE
jgi:hypothetical protein